MKKTRGIVALLLVAMLMSQSRTAMAMELGIDDPTPITSKVQFVGEDVEDPEEPNGPWRSLYTTEPWDEANGKFSFDPEYETNTGFGAGIDAGGNDGDGPGIQTGENNTPGAGEQTDANGRILPPGTGASNSDAGGSNAGTGASSNTGGSSGIGGSNAGTGASNPGTGASSGAGSSNTAGTGASNSGTGNSNAGTGASSGTGNSAGTGSSSNAGNSASAGNSGANNSGTGNSGTVGGNDNSGAGEQTGEDGKPINPNDGDKKPDVSGNDLPKNDDKTPEKPDDGKTGGDDKPADDNGQPTEPVNLTATNWQASVTFPNWVGAVDDTLVLNDIYAFEAVKGQGYINLFPSTSTESYELYINNKKLKTPPKVTESGKGYKVDISKYTVDGRNTIRIANIKPRDLKNAVKVNIPYPVVTVPKKAVNPTKYGIDKEPFKMIEQIIEKDVNHGYTGAQLAVIKSGTLVYSGAWGATNRYSSESPTKVTKTTLYDLAGLSTIYTSAAIEYLITKRAVSLDTRVVDILGDEFIDNTVMMDYYESGKVPSLDTVKAWKRQMTISHLLNSTSGLPASGYYYSDTYTGVANGSQKNPLYVEDGKKATTYNMAMKTPLLRAPGQVVVASDTDYILLGFIVEKITGMNLDAFIKGALLTPMGLEHTTYNPTKNGFMAEDCATTELTGNTRGGLISFPHVRTAPIQGTVHDELSYYAMEGVSGNAGIFANAEDLAKFGTLFLTGGYDQKRLISPAVLDACLTTSSEKTSGFVGGFRRTDGYIYHEIGQTASKGSLYKDSFTGCVLLVDPANSLVIAYTTNKIGTPITAVDPRMNKLELRYAQFSGNYFTAKSGHFAIELIEEGLKSHGFFAVKGAYRALIVDMLVGKSMLIAERNQAITKIRSEQGDSGATTNPFGYTTTSSSLVASDDIIQDYYALFEVAQARLGKGNTKKLATELLNSSRDSEFMEKTLKIKIKSKE